MRMKILDERLLQYPPSRATEGSAGIDLRACIPESRVLYVSATLSFSSGIAVEIPEGYVGLIFPRSGLGTRLRIGLSNTVGVIDHDYRGEVLLFMENRGDTPYPVTPLERVAQLVVVPCYMGNPVIVTDLTETGRGFNGFGSSGKV